MKKCSSLCKVAGTRDWNSWVAYGWQAARLCTQVKHAEKMNSHANWSIIGQKVQSGNSICSQLELATQSSREAKSPNVEHVPSKPEVEASCQLEHYRTKITD